MTTLSGTFGKYPSTRLRRTRRNHWVRRLVAENVVTPNDLVWAVFVMQGQGEMAEISSMPGVQRMTVDLLAKHAKEAFELGIPAIAIFPQTPDKLKSPDGDEALNPDNLVCQATKAVKNAVPEMGIICDVALDPYTTLGHDGLIRDNYVVNDLTVEVLCRQAINQVESGCDVIAPSDMMDGRITALRKTLDASGHENTLLLSYAAKYSSVFYGPFRDAVGSLKSLGNSDKRTYQMDPANASEAIREVAFDIEEGADMVMIKPGMPYLDIVREVKSSFALPTFVYQVSGEYAMLMAAEKKGWIDGDQAIIETLMSFKRAGADGVLTYAAVRAAKMLNAR